MKYFGAAALILSTTLIGITLSSEMKKRIEIWEQLNSLCNRLLQDITFYETPMLLLVENLLCDDEYKLLSFISADCLKQKAIPASRLKREENEEISRFFYSLGKSGIENQIMLINNFKNYACGKKEEYTECYKSKSRLYISYGAFFGIVVSLILI